MVRLAVIGIRQTMLERYAECLTHSSNFWKQDESDSLIVAATNYKKLLDFALFRRFDDVINYELPTPEQIRPLIENTICLFSHVILMIGRSLKNYPKVLAMQRLQEHVMMRQKLTVLDGKEHVSMQSIADMLEERARTKSNI